MLVWPAPLRPTTPTLSPLVRTRSRSWTTASPPASTETPRTSKAFTDVLPRGVALGMWAVRTSGSSWGLGMTPPGRDRRARSARGGPLAHEGSVALGRLGTRILDD